jgi:hypothetical protein
MLKMRRTIVKVVDVRINRAVAAAAPDQPSEFDAQAARRCGL